VLSLKLSRYGVTLPGADDLEEIALGGLLDAVRRAVAAQDGWRVAESAVLSCFSFAKEAVYRDLLGHEDLAAAHPAVRALVAGQTAGPGPGFAFDAIAEHEIDTLAPPETAPVILDADSSQRACIAASLDGRSFVMSGPPGTGKSQTIANMIGAALHGGKTVLFVSEKAAALDVVRDRLTGAGLGAYLLELHSHKATRTEVAASLAKALDTVPTAPAPMPHADVDRARQRREQLNAYADAMNRRRDPLGYSLHDILGVIANLGAIAAAPATGLAPVADLTVEAFGEIRRATAALATTWRAAVQGQSFAWRGVTERGPLDVPLYEAASALETLAGLARVNETLAEVTGLTRPSDADALAGLLSHLLTWPLSLPDEWLTAGTLDAVDATVSQLAAALSEIAAREDQATRAAGVPWPALPHHDKLPAVDAAAIAGLSPAGADTGGLTAEQIVGLSRAFAADADMLAERLRTLSGLASRLGLRAPATFGEAADLLAIAQLAREPDRPERGWLSSPGHQAAAKPGALSPTPTTRSRRRKPTPAPTTPPRHCTRTCTGWRTGSRTSIAAWASCPRATGPTRKSSPPSPKTGPTGTRPSSSSRWPWPGSVPRRPSPPPRPAAPRCSAGTTRAGRRTSTARPRALPCRQRRAEGARQDLWKAADTSPPMRCPTRQLPASRPRCARTCPPGRRAWHLRP
jgi:hypothetical protein